MNATSDGSKDFEVISTKFQLAITIRDQAKVADVARSRSATSGTSGPTFNGTE